MIQFENAVSRYKKIILDELSESANVKCWIAGGSIRDYFMGVKIQTDYDLFFPNETEYLKAEKYFTQAGALVKWQSENGMKVVYKGRTFDLVKHFFSGPQETIDNFDFTVSMLAVDSERVYHGQTTFIDLAKRQLMINKITYPASTLSRAFRYHKKGFSICLGEQKKIFDSINSFKVEPVEPTETGESSENQTSMSLGAFFIGID